MSSPPVAVPAVRTARQARGSWLASAAFPAPALLASAAAALRDAGLPG